MKNSTILTKRKKDITRIPAFVLLVAIGVAGYFYTNRGTQRIEKDGVWTIMTLTGKMTSAHKGWHYEAYYSLNGVRYVDSKTYGNACETSFVKSGLRYFIVCLPSDPHKKTDYSAPVPPWFTLDAPPEGWKEIPTVSQMRRMMDELNKIDE